MPNHSNTFSPIHGEANELIDQDALCEWIGRSKSTLQSWRRQGRGPRYIRLTLQGIRYRRSDVESWLESQAVETAPVEAPTKTTYEPCEVESIFPCAP